MLESTSAPRVFHPASTSPFYSPEAIILWTVSFYLSKGLCVVGLASRARWLLIWRRPEDIICRAGQWVQRIITNRYLTCVGREGEENKIIYTITESNIPSRTFLFKRVKTILHKRYQNLTKILQISFLTKQIVLKRKKNQRKWDLKATKENVNMHS